MKFKLFDKERDKKILKWIAIIVVVMAASITVKDEIVWQLEPMDEYYEDEYYNEEYGDCNVLGIDLHGYLFIDQEADDEISSTVIVDAIETADWNDEIKAIILDINSYGGEAVAAEEVANALWRSTKPVVALIRESGVSAGYWAATGAETIFASKNSNVGSIGVTMSYLDNVEQNRKEGLTYNRLSTGKFKDTGDPDKPLSYEEKELLMRDLKIVHENFIEAVAENRGLDIGKVRALADGSSMLGQMALDNGLIDRIGGFYEALEYLGTELGEPAVVCWE